MIAPSPEILAEFEAFLNLRRQSILSCPQFARLVKRSPQHIARQCKAGQIRAKKNPLRGKQPEGEWEIEYSEYERWVKNGGFTLKKKTSPFSC